MGHISVAVVVIAANLGAATALLPGHGRMHLIRQEPIGNGQPQDDTPHDRSKRKGPSEAIPELIALRTAIDRHVRSGKIGPSNLSDANLIQTGHTPTWQAFAVTLKRRPQRLAGFIDAVQKQEPWVMPHLSYIFAIDGMELSSDKDARELLVKNGYVSPANLKQSLKEPLAVSWWDLSPGAIGCYLSHAKVWEQIVDRDLDYGLIFEDDMRHFRSDFEKIVRTGLLESTQRKENDGDIVYLQHCDPSADWDRGSPIPPEGESSLHELDSDLIVPCTAGYLISNKAARQLLFNAFPIKVQLDRAMAGSALEGLRRLRYEPALAQVGNESASSDVQENSTSLTWLMNYIEFKIGDMLGLYDNVTDANVTDAADNATAEKLTEIVSAKAAKDNSSNFFARWFPRLAEHQAREDTPMQSSSDE